MSEIIEFEMVREEEKQRWVTKIKQRIEKLEEMPLNQYFNIHGSDRKEELKSLLENEE